MPFYRFFVVPNRMNAPTARITIAEHCTPKRVKSIPALSSGAKKIIQYPDPCALPPLYQGEEIKRPDSGKYCCCPCDFDLLAIHGEVLIPIRI